VFALAPSRLEPNVIWAGSDDGLVHVTRDDGRSWQNVTPAGLPPFLKITTIEDSPTRPGTAFLAGNRFLLDDLAPYLLRTDDYGQHWTSIAAGLPADEMVRSVREDTSRPGLLYIGTERGVKVSFDDGRRWQSLQRELPVVQVSDLAVTDHDLVIATHGRSFWVLDNIDVIRQLGRPVAGKPGVRLFRPAPAVRGVDEGVIIDYYLPRPPRSLTLDILDSRGQPVWHFIGAPEDPEKAKKKKKAEEEALGQGGGEDDDDETVPKPGMKAGLNRYTWDMNYPGYTEFKDMILWAAANHGPAALPGEYQVRLTVDGKVQTQTAAIRLDPRLGSVKPADVEARFALATRIRDQVSRANQAVLLARGIRRQVAAVLTKTSDPSLRSLANALDARVVAVEGAIYQVRNRSEQDPLNYPIMLNNKLAALIGVVESGEAAPTLQTQSVFTDLSARLDRELAELDRLLAVDMPVLNAQLKRNRLPTIERRSEAAVEQGTANRKDDDGDR
ncbi:MAG: glycosyl hydrolase, partial [Sphingomicrobium sp.]